MPQTHYPVFAPVSPGAVPEAWPRDARAVDTRHPGRTLLMEAALANDVAAVEALLPRSDRHAKDVKGRTALHHAAESPVRGDGSVRALLDAGLDPQALCAAGMTPMMYACQETDLAKVNALWDVSDLRQTSWAGHSLMVLAAWGQHALEVLPRLAPVCDATLRSHDGQGLWHHAQSVATLDWLHAQGLGSARDVDKDLRTPLMLHVTSSRPDMVERLIPWSDLCARDKNGHTALVRAMDANLWKNAGLVALAMPVAEAMATLASRPGARARSLERRVIDAEQQALRATMVDASLPETTPAKPRRSRL